VTRPATKRGQGAKPKYYSAAQVEELQSELTQARSAVDAANRHVTEVIAAYQQQYPDACSLHTAHEVRKAVSRSRDLARRAVHIHQSGGARAAGLV
jgi:hypothetical protein